MISEKVLIVIPYFGKLPNYFEMWLLSARFNKDFEWLLLLDDKTSYDFPENVHVEYTTFQSLKKRIQEKFDFQIILHSPYKLCDYRPAYGYIFNEYIKGYDFWGYGDLDLIYGNLSNFITDQILSEYDKVLSVGHLTLFRNNDYMNSSYQLLARNLPSYKEAFSDEKPFTFDEWGGVTRIFNSHPIKQYQEGVMADISWYFYRFKSANGHANYKKTCFVWNNGVLFQLYYKDGELGVKEFPYVHFQKRKMDVKYSTPLDSANTIVVTPQGFETLSTSDIMNRDFLSIDFNDEIRALLSFYIRLFKRAVNKLRKKIA